MAGVVWGLGQRDFQSQLCQDLSGIAAGFNLQAWRVRITTRLMLIESPTKIIGPSCDLVTISKVWGTVAGTFCSSWWQSLHLSPEPDAGASLTVARTAPQLRSTAHV